MQKVSERQDLENLINFQEDRRCVGISVDYRSV